MRAASKMSDYWYSDDPLFIHQLCMIERQILIGLMQGKYLQDVATQVGISLRSADFYCTHILRVYCCATMSELLATRCQTVSFGG